MHHGGTTQGMTQCSGRELEAACSESQSHIKEDFSDSVREALLAVDQLGESYKINEEEHRTRFPRADQYVRA